MIWCTKHFSVAATILALKKSPISAEQNVININITGYHDYNTTKHHHKAMWVKLCSLTTSEGLSF